MPTQRGLLNPYKYNKNTTNTNILLHTGYDFHPFQQEIFNPSSYQVQLLKSYLETCKQLRVNQLLIHGPDQPKSLEFYTAGLTILKSYLDEFNSNLSTIDNIQQNVQLTQTNITQTNTKTTSQNTTSEILNKSVQLNQSQQKLKYKLQICIEMPAFCKSMYSILNQSDIYDFTLSYFNEAVKKGFDIVIDTAHLFSNGLETNQIIDILEIFKNNYKFIHLNGNAHAKFKKDKHTTLTSCPDFEPNLIPKSNLILEKVSILMNSGKVCISEQKCNNITYFNKLSKQYNFKLNESIPANLII
jgi:hypothetical protein